MQLLRFARSITESLQQIWSKAAPLLLAVILIVCMQLLIACAAPPFPSSTYQLPTPSSLTGEPKGLSTYSLKARTWLKKAANWSSNAAPIVPP